MPKNLEFNREQIRVKVHSLRESGKTWREIGDATGKSKDAARKIYYRVINNNSFKEKPRSGRPHKLSDEREIAVQS